MGQHYSPVLRWVRDYLPDPLVDLVLGHGSAVELENLVLDINHCLLSYDGSHLTRIVLLDIDHELSTCQLFPNDLSRERASQSYLQKFDTDSILVKHPHRIQNSPLGRSPAHNCSISLFLVRSEEVEFLLLRNLVSRGLQL